MYYIDSSAVQTPIKVVMNTTNLKNISVLFMQDSPSNHIISGKYE
jgi:hypothetical protein